MIQRIGISDLLSGPKDRVLIDVRTPDEYAQAHIPGALNLPLFSNEERAIIGTLYKQESREAAILKGFDLVGPKWSQYIKEALGLAPKKKIVLYCWRGGLRSGVMAWAMDTYGFEVATLDKGYKSYRNWAFEQFKQPYSLLVLSGLTGSHKTDILLALAKKGEQIIDLEGLAQHQGSAFGSMGRLVQPTQEQFENNLAFELHGLNACQRIWIEDESRNIGKRVIPLGIWEQMRSVGVLQLILPPEEREQYLLNTYGQLDKNFLLEKTRQIERRLGPQRTKSAIEAIEAGRMEEFIRITLAYYDKGYLHGLGKRASNCIHTFETHYTSAEEAAEQVLQFAQKEHLN